MSRDLYTKNMNFQLKLCSGDSVVAYGTSSVGDITADLEHEVRYVAFFPTFTYC